MSSEQSDLTPTVDSSNDVMWAIITMGVFFIIGLGAIAIQSIK